MTDLKNNEKNGHYLGTEINEKWWRRYSRNKMLARGKGNYWYDDNSFFFLRILTNNPISISFSDIVEFKVGKWHAGKWGNGKPILKIIWFDNTQKLSSGFIIHNELVEVNKLIDELKNRLDQSK